MEALNSRSETLSSALESTKLSTAFVDNFAEVQIASIVRKI